MLERNWKQQWLQLCLARSARTIRIVGKVVNPMRSNPSLRVFWKPVNLQGHVWENLYRLITKTTLQEKGDNSLQHYNFVHKFILMPQAMKIPAAKAAVDQEWEKLEKLSAWNLTKVRSKKEVIDEARTKGARVHFASLMYICHLKNAELEAKHQKIQRSSCTPRQYCKRRFWILCSVYRTKIISITDDSGKSHGYHFQTAGLRRTSSGRNIC